MANMVTNVEELASMYPEFIDDHIEPPHTVSPPPRAADVYIVDQFPEIVEDRAGKLVSAPPQKLSKPGHVDQGRARTLTNALARRQSRMYLSSDLVEEEDETAVMTASADTVHENSVLPAGTWKRARGLIHMQTIFARHAAEHQMLHGTDPTIGGGAALQAITDPEQAPITK